jgi:hypothetical protein
MAANIQPSKKGPLDKFFPRTTKIQAAAGMERSFDSFAERKAIEIAEFAAKEEVKKKKRDAERNEVKKVDRAVAKRAAASLAASEPGVEDQTETIRVAVQ